MSSKRYIPGLSIQNFNESRSNPKKLVNLESSKDYKLPPNLLKTFKAGTINPVSDCIIIDNAAKFIIIILLIVALILLLILEFLDDLKKIMKNRNRSSVLHKISDLIRLNYTILDLLYSSIIKNDVLLNLIIYNLEGGSTESVLWLSGPWLFLPTTNLHQQR